MINRFCGIVAFISETRAAYGEQGKQFCNGKNLFPGSPCGRAGREKIFTMTFALACPYIGYFNLAKFETKQFSRFVGLEHVDTIVCRELRSRMRRSWRQRRKKPKRRH